MSIENDEAGDGYLPALNCVVIYLSRRGDRPDPGLVDEDDGAGTGIRFRYRVLKLWELDPRTVLELESPDLAPLAPLMKCDDPAEMVIESRKKIVAAGVPDARRNDLRMALGTFAGLRIEDNRLLEELVWEKSMDLEETPLVRGWIQRGERRGLKKGLQKGLQRGLRQGVQKGVHQGLLEGRRGALLSVLSTRFGPVKKDLRARILRIDDPNLIEKLVKRAAVAPSLSRFFEQIP